MLLTLLIYIVCITDVNTSLYKRFDIILKFDIILMFHSPEKEKIKSKIRTKLKEVNGNLFLIYISNLSLN